MAGVQAEKHSRSPRICVVGACNVDLIAYVPRLPKLGETLKGHSFQQGYGGKGANQAVMAAKLGGDVIMIGKVGDDVFGRGTLENFKKWNVCTQHILTTNRASSGVAPIAVDTNGNNSIIIVGGANDLLSVEDVERARKDISSCSIMLCQLELPFPITAAALRIAKEEGVTTILNTAPAPTEQSDFDDYIFKYCDIVCPNEHELEQLTNQQVDTLENVEQASRILLSRGVKQVLVTLGERGCMLISKSGIRKLDGEKVEVVDTTGAGDCFLGAFAYFLAAGCECDDAMHRANAIAAISVGKHGTQTSYPCADTLPSTLMAI